MITVEFIQVALELIVRALADLGRRIAGTRRCVECGAPTRRVIRVCEPCADDPRSAVAMCTRADIRERAARHPGRVRCLGERVRELPIVFRGRTGRMYYWKRDADALFA